MNAQKINMILFALYWAFVLVGLYPTYKAVNYVTSAAAYLFYLR